MAMPDSFFCSYHGWTYRTDGTLESLPLPDGYRGTKLSLDGREFGLKPVPRVASHRGFVFASLAADGPDLATFSWRGGGRDRQYVRPGA